MFSQVSVRWLSVFVPLVWGRVGRIVFVVPFLVGSPGLSLVCIFLLFLRLLASFPPLCNGEVVFCRNCLRTRDLPFAPVVIVILCWELSWGSVLRLMLGLSLSQLPGYCVAALNLGLGSMVGRLLSRIFMFDYFLTIVALSPVLC